RYSLDSDPLQKTTFAEELRALELYLHIEKARFQDRLKLEIDVDPKARRAMAPSLLLQPAVENAIKYSIAKRTEGGALRLKAHVREGRLFLAVCDDGPGLPGDPMKTLRDCAGVGFANMRDRLIHLYGEDHSFVIRNLAPKGFAVEIDIPFEEDA
ncbi:MAG: ATP-binding protein, partial [Pseudomonadota bacterium]